MKYSEKVWDIPTRKNYNICMQQKNDLGMKPNIFVERIIKYCKINSAGNSHNKIDNIFERVKKCPCDNCFYYDKCAENILACRRYYDWLQLGRLKRREVN